MPSADRALRMADVLGVDPKWLILGSAGKGDAGANLSDSPPALYEMAEPEPADGWQATPYYRLMDIIAGAPAIPSTRLWLREAWMRRLNADGLDVWITDMPPSFAPHFPLEGEPVLCAAAGALYEDAVYLVQFDGAVSARRLVITGGKPMLLGASPDDEPQEPPARDRPWGAPPCFVGRVLARVLRPL